MKDFNIYELEINNRAFNAIKDKRKRVEIRTTKINDDFDYKIIKEGDTIIFTSYNGEKIKCIVNKVNWYKTIEELLTVEGTKYTLSSTDDFDKGVESINSFPGYIDGIKMNGIYAIHIESV